MTRSAAQPLLSKQGSGKDILQNLVLYAIYSGSAITVIEEGEKGKSKICLQSPISTKALHFLVSDASHQELIVEFLEAIPRELAKLIAFSPSPLLQLLRNKTTTLHNKMLRLYQQHDIALARQQIIDELRALILKHPLSINEQDIFGETLMMTAVRIRDIVLVDFLIKNNADINVTNFEYRSAIEICSGILIENIIRQGEIEDYKNILSLLLSARKFVPVSTIDHTFRQLSYFFTDASREKLKILISATNQLNPTGQQAMAFANTKEINAELKHLVTNSWRVGNKGKTRIEKQMPYYLLSLFISARDLLKSPQTNPQELSLIFNEIRVLSEMMRINQDRLIIQSIPDFSLQKELKLQMIDNLAIKISSMSSTEDLALMQEIVIPICDFNQNHCSYLAIRITPQGYFFRVENLAYDPEYQEIKKFHPCRSSKQNQARLLTSSAIVFTTDKKEVMQMGRQLEIKSILGRAIWNQELFLKTWLNYPLLLRTPCSKRFIIDNLTFLIAAMFYLVSSLFSNKIASFFPTNLPEEL